MIFTQVITFLMFTYSRTFQMHKKVTKLSLQRSTYTTSLLRSPPPLEPVSPQSWSPRVTTPTACASCPQRWACTAWVWGTGACTCRAAPSSSLWGRWARAVPPRWGLEVQDWRERRQESQVHTDIIVTGTLHILYVTTSSSTSASYQSYMPHLQG